MILTYILRNHMYAHDDMSIVYEYILPLFQLRMKEDFEVQHRRNKYL